MKGEIYLLDLPEAVIIGDDLNLYRVDSSTQRHRKRGDRIVIPRYARKEGTLKKDGEILE